MSDEDIVAFGSNRVDGHKCPAKRAGFNTADARVNHIAGTFDKLAGEEDFIGESGTMPESEASKLWSEVIEEMSGEEERRIAIDIAEGNGWR